MRLFEVPKRKRKSRYEITDVKEANLFREQFPYVDLPKIVFDHETVPLEPAPEFWITDTTFRDGQQALPPFTAQQIVAFFELIHQLDGGTGIIRQSEFFLYTDKDREAVTKCLERGYQYPEITGWIRANLNDLKLVKQMGLKETGMLMSASDYHIFNKLRLTRKQAAEKYLAAAKEAISQGIRIRCHLEDITRADFDGFVLPLTQAMMELSKEAKVPITIRACDTMGFGTTYDGAGLPRSVQKVIHALRHEGGVPPERLEWHGHNDFYCAVHNAASTWLYGCAAANGTMLGIGERTGNTPIEGLLMEYCALKGRPPQLDLTRITEIARYFGKEIGLAVPENAPLIGQNFNVTRAGIHADGLLKDEEIYNIFDTKKFLNRPVDVAITDKSGSAGIAEWVNLHMAANAHQKVAKEHSGVHQIKRWVDEQYEHGRVGPISNDEIAAKAREFLPELFR